MSTSAIRSGAYITSDRSDQAVSVLRSPWVLDEPDTPNVVPDPPPVEQPMQQRTEVDVLIDRPELGAGAATFIAAGDLISDTPGWPAAPAGQARVQVGQVQHVGEEPIAPSRGRGVNIITPGKAKPRVLPRLRERRRCLSNRSRLSASRPPHPSGVSVCSAALRQMGSPR